MEEVLAHVLGDHDAAARHHRLSAAGVARADHEGHHLEHGELGVRAVATVLQAAGVEPGERFLDVGSGDGVPVLAAALLHPDRFGVCRGLEVVADRVVRARNHAERLRAWLATHGRGADALRAAPIELHHGDVFEASGLLGDTTLALCFATTWSSGAPRRELPRLSAALHASMPTKARAILVDGRLLEADGWRWEGDLRVHTPDTAPYATARLYTRTT